MSKDDSIKSVIIEDNKYKVIVFCCFKCFENKNDWKQKYIKKRY